MVSSVHLQPHSGLGHLLSEPTATQWFGACKKGILVSLVNLQSHSGFGLVKKGYFASQPHSSEKKAGGNDLRSEPTATQ